MGYRDRGELPVRDSKPRVELVEGVDYYVENGRWVFTAVYHLKRGYCCDSGCRHCPYQCESRPDETGREPD
jgi:hypothetical protein